MTVVTTVVIPKVFKHWNLPKSNALDLSILMISIIKEKPCSIKNLECSYPKKYLVHHSESQHLELFPIFSEIICNHLVKQDPCSTPNQSDFNQYFLKIHENTRFQTRFIHSSKNKSPHFPLRSPESQYSTL
jgi:hypothetical protein